MNESTNITDTEDLTISSTELDDQNKPESGDPTHIKKDQCHIDDADSVQETDGNDEPLHESDRTERYWLDGSSKYQMALERGELFENSDDIKPVKVTTEFESFASTRIGGRKENQDTAAFRLTKRGLLLVVCDGMGGGPSGKRASFLAAHAISRHIGQCDEVVSDARLMEDALQEAHKVLKFDISKHPENFGMGTTAAALLLNTKHAVFAHVGDSRIYQFREGKLIFRTTDHSLVARKMKIEGWTDEEARTSDESNVITQAIGHRDIEPDIEIRPFLKDDRFLICTDGIWGHYPQKQLLQIICGSRNPGGALSDLMVTTDNIGIEEGNRHDNFTAIISQTNISSKSKDAMTKISKLIICVLGVLLLVSFALNIVQYKRFGSSRSGTQTEEPAVPSISMETPVPGDISTNVPISETPETAQVKNDTVYIIKDGDLISKIAICFNVSTEDIKQANPDIDLNKIRIGQSIVIPLNNNGK